MKFVSSLLPVPRTGLLAVMVMCSLAACRGESDGTGAPAADGPPPAGAGAEPAPAGEVDASDACPAPTQAGSGDNQAGLVVTFGDGTTETICVAFSEEQINGYELLQRSGLTIVSEPFTNPPGYAICKISNGGSDGCNYPDQKCFCNGGLFWAFWILQDNSSWVFSPVGVSQAPVNNGDVQGQKWESGEDPPPVCTFEQICGVAAAPAGEG